MFAFYRLTIENAFSTISKIKLYTVVITVWQGWLIYADSHNLLYIQFFFITVIFSVTYSPNLNFKYPYVVFVFLKGRKKNIFTAAKVK